MVNVPQMIGWGRLFLTLALLGTGAVCLAHLWHRLEGKKNGPDDDILYSSNNKFHVVQLHVFIVRW